MVNNIHGPLNGSGAAEATTVSSAPVNFANCRPGPPGGSTVPIMLSAISLPPTIILEVRAFVPGDVYYGPFHPLGVGCSAPKDISTSVGVATTTVDLVWETSK